MVAYLKYLLLAAAPLVAIAFIWVAWFYSSNIFNKKKSTKTFKKIYDTSPYRKNELIKPDKKNEFRSRKLEQQIQINAKTADGLMKVSHYNEEELQQEEEMIVGFVILGKWTKKAAKDFMYKVRGIRAGRWTNRIRANTQVPGQSQTRGR